MLSLYSLRMVYWANTEVFVSLIIGVFKHGHGKGGNYSVRRSLVF